MSVNSIRDQLASDAGVSVATAQTLSGADLEQRKLHRLANSSTGSAADLLESVDRRPNAHVLWPDSGAAAGGTAVVIVGEGLTGTTGVLFDDSAGTSLTVIDDYHLEITTPAETAALIDVTVQHPDGDITLTDAFTFA